MKKCDILRFALSQFHPGICLYRTNTEVLRVFNTIEATLFLCYYHLYHIHDQHHTHMPIECIYLFKWNYIQNGINSFKNEFEIATDTYVNTFNALNELRGKWSLDDSNNTNRKLFLNCMKNNKIKKKNKKLEKMNWNGRTLPLLKCFVSSRKIHYLEIERWKIVYHFCLLLNWLLSIMSNFDSNQMVHLAPRLQM